MQGQRDKNVTRVRINFAQTIGAVGEWYMKRQALAECVDRTEKTKEKRRFAEKKYFCNVMLRQVIATMMARDHLWLAAVQ